MKTAAALLCVSMCFLAGCSTLADARDAKGTGERRMFDAPFEIVWREVPKAANDLDLGVVGTYPDERYYLLQRGWTAFSWGEKVAVFVESKGVRQTEVEIVSKRVMATNITAPNWSKRLLDQIAERLAKQ